jgi:hypothetical protein
MVNTGSKLVKNMYSNKMSGGFGASQRISQKQDTPNNLLLRVKSLLGKELEE